MMMESFLVKEQTIFMHMIDLNMTKPKILNLFLFFPSTFLYSGTLVRLPNPIRMVGARFSREVALLQPSAVTADGKHYMQDLAGNTTLGIRFPAGHPCNASLFDWRQPAYDLQAELLKADPDARGAHVRGRWYPQFCAQQSLVVAWDRASGTLCASGGGPSSFAWESGDYVLAQRAHATFNLLSDGVRFARPASFGARVIRLDDNPDQLAMCPATHGYFVRSPAPVPSHCPRTIPAFEYVPDALLMAQGRLQKPERSFDTEIAPLAAAAQANPQATKCGFAGAASHFRRVQLFDHIRQEQYRLCR